MDQSLAVQNCRIVAPERLSDRFLASGVLQSQENILIGEQVVLAYIFEIHKPWFPSSKVLPTLLETLTKEHTALDASKDVADQFELLLRNLNQQLNTLSEQGETDWIGNLNGIIMALSGNQLHFSQTGRCPAYLLQNNRIRQITDDTTIEREPHPLKTFSNLASGILQEQDYILLANQELYNEISLDALRRIINSHTPAQSVASIVKELKKEKNPAVSSIILKVIPRAEAENLKTVEITEVLLEEELQSNFKKLRKRLSPFAALIKEKSATAGAASWQATKQAGSLMKDTVAPAAIGLVSKGVEQAKNLKRPAPSVTQPVVEIIPPKAIREQRAAGIVEPQEEGVIDESQTFIPLDEFALEGSPPLEQKEKKSSLITTSLSKIKTWFSSPANKKLTALVLAGILMIVAVKTAISKHQPASTPATNQNEQHIAEARSLQQKALTAVDLKQNIEAAREIDDSQKILNNLSGLNEAQKKEADQIWEDLTKVADSLNQTTRLTEADTEYPFSTAGQQMISNLPYFYSVIGSQAGLLRTGKGDMSQTKKTIPLPDSTDGFVSIAKSSEQDTTAYALTRKNKVYRVIQDGEDTTLRAITPNEGDFATGDAIGSYIGNVYILDGKSGILWKYLNTGTAYNKGVSVIDNTQYDIKQSISLAIDGNIYILKQDGNLLKFSHGQQQSDFVLKNVPALSQKMLQPLQVITNDAMDSIFILDGGITSSTHSSAKVLEFNKNGVFVRQFGFPKNFTQVRSFDIDQKTKKLWILNGAEVSEFSI